MSDIKIPAELWMIWEEDDDDWACAADLEEGVFPRIVALNAEEAEKLCESLTCLVGGIFTPIRVK